MRDGFGIFVRKEVVEILKTWRIWVLPGIALFFAASGPLMARWTPEIVTAATGAQGEALMKLLGGPPTYLDSYAQWIKNLSQIVFFAILIIYGGLISSERKSGTAILVLTKPISRASFVAAKALVHGVFVSVITVIGTAITWGVTRVVFGIAPGGPLWQGSLAWLAFALFFLGAMTLLSVLLDSQAGAAGFGIALYAALALASVFPVMTLLTPAGLVSAPAAIAAGAEFPSVWAVITTLAGAVLFVAAAASLFSKQEL
jgi:ABC-2 type transport system permease protein